MSIKSIYAAIYGRQSESVTMCGKCGGLPEIWPEDEGPFIIQCNDCGFGTISWAYATEAWQCWEDINKSDFRDNTC